jgi:hypothetical protein
MLGGKGKGGRVGQRESPSGTEVSPCLRVANLQKIFFSMQLPSFRKKGPIAHIHTHIRHTNMQIHNLSMQPRMPSSHTPVVTHAVVARASRAHHLPLSKPPEAAPECAAACAHPLPHH